MREREPMKERTIMGLDLDFTIGTDIRRIWWKIQFGIEHRKEAFGENL